jgi:hypothetical protein
MLIGLSKTEVNFPTVRVIGIDPWSSDQSYVASDVTPKLQRVGVV